MLGGGIWGGFSLGGEHLQDGDLLCKETFEGRWDRRRILGIKICTGRIHFVGKNYAGRRYLRDGGLYWEGRNMC